MSDDHKLTPGQKVDLSEMEADGKALHDDRKEAEKEFKRLRKAFRNLQARLYAEDKRQMLIVFQAMDAGGKDGSAGTDGFAVGALPNRLHGSDSGLSRGEYVGGIGQSFGTTLGSEVC